LRKRLLQLVAIAVVAVCFGSHVSELADNWDHTFETGNDIESILIVVALTAGAVITIGAAVGFMVFKVERELEAAPSLVDRAAESVLHTCTHSPPLIALRI
jgi:hypothetical protein